MYCSKSGKQSKDGAEFCEHCGEALSQSANKPAYAPLPPWNHLTVLGFIFTLIPIVHFVGFILCLVGRKQCGKTGERGKGLATAGVAINALLIAVLLVGLVIFAGRAIEANRAVEAAQTTLAPGNRRSSWSADEHPGETDPYGFNEWLNNH